MAAQVRAFSFVDRITAMPNAGQIRGSYRIPAGLDEFPLALAGEAVGQLAAWAAMKAVDFEYRPLAGLAGSIELLRLARPGHLLELSVEIEDVDSERVEYNGTACQAGEPVVRLRDCVGPMVPLADMDDPALLRTRFDVLCRGESDAGAVTGLPPLLLECRGGEAGCAARAIFHVPSAAPFFSDHFPRRPLFPGSLLMHLKIQLGAALAAEIPQPPTRAWVPDAVRDMKLRSFIGPGETLRLEARLKQHSNEAVTLALETRTDKELVATASLRLKPGDSDGVPRPPAARPPLS
jgi:3-hydroxymyristoyl/3-hydroxydecanoyl-(acyl carrier protein) dehydratase